MVNLASFMGQSSGVTLSANDECVRRIVLEAKNYIRDPHTAVEIFPGKSKYVALYFNSFTYFHYSCNIVIVS